MNKEFAESIILESEYLDLTNNIDKINLEVDKIERRLKEYYGNNFKSNY